MSKLTIAAAALLATTISLGAITPATAGRGHHYGWFFKGGAPGMQGQGSGNGLTITQNGDGNAASAVQLGGGGGAINISQNGNNNSVTVIQINRGGKGRRPLGRNGAY